MQPVRDPAGQPVHHGEHEYPGHDKHAGHDLEMLRRRFWLTLALTIPLDVVRAALAALLPDEADVVDLGLLHPRPQRLDPDPELISDPLSRAVFSAELLAELTHRSDRPVLLTLRIPARARLPRRHLMWHDSILVSEIRSLQPSQGG